MTALPADTFPPLTLGPVAGALAPALTVEWLVARDIDSYSRRRSASEPGLRAPVATPATMDVQASTRPSPASLRKNGPLAGSQ